MAKVCSSSRFPPARSATISRESMYSTPTVSLPVTITLVASPCPARIRSLVTKSGGSIATQGSVTRLFHRKGQIIIPRDVANEDQLMEIALEAGAEDFKAEPQGYEIITSPT